MWTRSSLVLGAIALVLAMVGIYGVVSYFVTSGRRIGVRGPRHGPALLAVRGAARHPPIVAELVAELGCHSRRRHLREHGSVGRTIGDACCCCGERAVALVASRARSPGDGFPSCFSRSSGSVVLCSCFAVVLCSRSLRSFLQSLCSRLLESESKRRLKSEYKRRIQTANLAANLTAIKRRYKQR